jgi:hypothetical protein
LCLKDTCGTVVKSDFDYIINKCIENGVPSNKIALHLHVLNDSEENTVEIIHSALDKKINIFDVSKIKTGGCINNNNNNLISNKKIPTNLTYNLFYKSIVDYIINNK